MRPRSAIVGVTVCALVVDAMVGAVRAGLPSAPFATLCTVTALSVAGGPSTGMLVGFASGVALDLLAGPVSPGGTHALVGLALGACAGALRPRTVGPVGGGATVGAPSVAFGVVATLGLQGLLLPIASLPAGLVAIGAVVGAVACPMVVRVVSRPLSERSRAA